MYDQIHITDNKVKDFEIYARHNDTPVPFVALVYMSLRLCIAVTFVVVRIKLNFSSSVTIWRIFHNICIWFSCTFFCFGDIKLQWRHNVHDGVSNHQPHDCLLNRLFRLRSKKTSKLCVTGLCAGYSPVTGECPAQRASNAKNVSIWWRHHDQFFLIHLEYLQYCSILLHWHWTIV